MTQTSKATAQATDTRGEMMSDDRLRGLLQRYGVRPAKGFAKVDRDRLLAEVRHHNLIERSWAEVYG